MRGGGDAGAQHIVEGLDFGAVRKIVVAFPVVGDGQRNTGNVAAAVQLLGKIAAGIGDDLIIHVYTPMDKNRNLRYNNRIIQK